MNLFIRRTIKNCQDEKICFSKIDYKAEHDYLIKFSNRQKMHLFQRKFIKIQFIFDFFIEVAEACQTHCEKLNAFNLLFLNEKIEKKFDIFVDRMKFHQRKILNMKNKLRNIFNLICFSIYFHNIHSS